jgi:glycosyltransferase involved in cell wall biosynthesis
VKILHINKFFWVAGGVERYMFDVADLFRGHGHEVHFFSMDDPERNMPSDDAKYFVSHVDYKTTTYAQKLRQGVRIAGKTIYSTESRRKIRELIRDIQPDIAHIHLIDHQISPSILPELQAAGIPIVQSIHEFKRICPNYRLYIDRTGEICERCLDGNYTHAIRQRCLKDSTTASALVAAAMYLHKWSGIWEKNVDIAICPTRFMQDMLARGGVPESQLTTLPYMIKLEDYTPVSECDDHILYAGRLAPEKGLLTLLKAMESLPHIPLKIAGQGPMLDAMKQHIADNNMTNVELLGYLDAETLHALMARARFLVFPSEWYEPGAVSIWESQALERPVIGARIGGIPETMEDGISGVLFEPGNVTDLTEKIHDLYDDQDTCRQMGRRARQAVLDRAEGHYEALMAIYEGLLARR